MGWRIQWRVVDGPAGARGEDEHASVRLGETVEFTLAATRESPDDQEERASDASQWERRFRLQVAGEDGTRGEPVTAAPESPLRLRYLFRWEGRKRLTFSGRPRLIPSREYTRTSSVPRTTMEAPFPAIDLFLRLDVLTEDAWARRFGGGRAAPEAPREERREPPRRHRPRPRTEEAAAPLPEETPGIEAPPTADDLLERLRRNQEALDRLRDLAGGSASPPEAPSGGETPSAEPPEEPRGPALRVDPESLEGRARRPLTPDELRGLLERFPRPHRRPLEDFRPEVPSFEPEVSDHMRRTPFLGNLLGIVVGTARFARELLQSLVDMVVALNGIDARLRDGRARAWMQEVLAMDREAWTELAFQVVEWSRDPRPLAEAFWAPLLSIAEHMRRGVDLATEDQVESSAHIWQATLETIDLIGAAEGIVALVEHAPSSLRRLAAVRRRLAATIARHADDAPRALERAASSLGDLPPVLRGEEGLLDGAPRLEERASGTPESRGVPAEDPEAPGAATEEPPRETERAADPDAAASAVRVRVTETLETAVARQNRRLAEAIRNRDADFLRRLGLRPRTVDILLNRVRRGYAPAYGRAMEALLERSIRTDPELGRLFEHIGSRRGVAVAGPGRPDWRGSGPFEGWLMDLTTTADRTPHVGRYYGEHMLVLTYDRLIPAL